jgi:hypothetical protein
LPWQGLKAKDDKEKEELVMDLKINLPIEELCDGLPNAFVEYISYTRSLGFKDKPDYAHLRKLFRRLFNTEKFKYDNVFDWTIKLFNEQYRPEEPVPTVPRTRGPKDGPHKMPNARGIRKRGR